MRALKPVPMRGTHKISGVDLLTSLLGEREMAYDRSIVNFTEEEHNAAAALDEIYEALADGVDLTTDVAAIFGPTVKLYGFLSKGESIEDFANMLIGLAVMLARDNQFLDGSDEDVPE